MPRDRKTMLLIGLYVAAGLLLAGLLAAEWGRDRFSDCMSLGAFSRQDCEEFARE
jgi:hypothetical protein